MATAGYLDYAVTIEDNMPASSSLYTRFPQSPFTGKRVNDSFAYLGSALRNLGDSAAKLPIDGDGAYVLGPNNGRIGTMAWQDADAVDIATGTLGWGVRGSLPPSTLISWVGTWSSLVDSYNNLRLSGFDICDGRITTNPYPPYNSVTMPNYLGLFVYFYDDASLLAQGVFSHTKTTSTAGSHSHTGSTGGVALTGTYLPTLARTKAVQGGAGAGVVDEYSGAGASHAHAIAADGSHAHTVDVRPASLSVVPLLRVY